MSPRKKQPLWQEFLVDDLVATGLPLCHRPGAIRGQDRGGGEAERRPQHRGHFHQSGRTRTLDGEDRPGIQDLPRPEFLSATASARAGSSTTRPSRAGILTIDAAVLVLLTATAGTGIIATDFSPTRGIQWVP